MSDLGRASDSPKVKRVVMKSWRQGFTKDTQEPLPALPLFLCLLSLHCYSAQEGPKGAFSSGAEPISIPLHPPCSSPPESPCSFACQSLGLCLSCVPG